MSFPFEYDHGSPLTFGGAMPHARTFDESKAVVLPVPVDRTTSYGGGTRHGPHEILQASSHMELWDEELGVDVHGVGIFTLPEMELPFGELTPLMNEIQRVASEILARDKFLVTIGGEHSITPPLVAAAAAKHPGLSVLQIDAHADLRDSYMGTRNNHACAMRQDPTWVESVVESLSGPVYITIDVDGMDPAIMPATGTPEPGGLSWYELLDLLRATFEKRRVVACDVVELSPIPGMHAPNFLCAKLIYKMITYRFARECRR